MNISLDFDNTYTRDPKFWNNFIELSKQSGHTIYCVTARSPREGLEVFNTIGKLIGEDHCYFTSMTAKRNYMFKQGISIDVWIDDMPFFIENGVEDVAIK